MKQFHFVEPVLRMGISFFWDCNSDEFLDYCEDIDDKQINTEKDELIESAIWLTVTEAWLIPAIWLANIDDAPVVVHEAVHAVHSIMKYKWIKLSNETEEIFAYYQEFIYNCYLEWVLWQEGKINVKFWIDDARYKLAFTREKCEEVVTTLWLVEQKKPKKAKKKE